MSFTPATEEERRAALGDLAGLLPELRAMLIDAEGFPPVPAPGPQDWLASQPEPGQSFDQWLAAAPNPPSAGRDVIYLQPLAAAPDPSLVADLRAFARRFFDLRVELLDPATPAVRERNHPQGGQRQQRADQLLAALKPVLPGDAFCHLGVTAGDLYPEEGWSFCFGAAAGRTAVVSLARYDTAFLNRHRGTAYPATAPAELLRRACKAVAHEVGHVAGIAHEIHYHDLMCGAMHLAETDSAPLAFGPLSLRKLHHLVAFDPVRRCRRLAAWYREHGLFPEGDRCLARARLAERERN